MQRGQIIWQLVTARLMRRSITVALASQPRLLREMLWQLIDDQPGLRVVVATGDPAKLLRVLRSGWVDWVVTMTDPLPLHAAVGAPSRNRGVSFVVLSRDTRTAEVTIPTRDGQPLRRVIANLTLDQLFAILRRQEIQ